MIQPTNSNISPNNGDHPRSARVIPKNQKEWEELAFNLMPLNPFEEDGDEGYEEWACDNDEIVSHGGRSDDLLLSGFDAALYLVCPEVVRSAPEILKPYHDRTFQIVFVFGEPPTNNESPSLFLVGVIAGYAALGLVPIHTALDLMIDIWWLSRERVAEMLGTDPTVRLVQSDTYEDEKAFEEWMGRLATRQFKEPERRRLRV